MCVDGYINQLFHIVDYFIVHQRPLTFPQNRHIMWEIMWER
jgi:hypothetical protein